MGLGGGRGLLFECGHVVRPPLYPGYGPPFKNSWIRPCGIHLSVYTSSHVFNRCKKKVKRSNNKCVIVIQGRISILEKEIFTDPPGFFYNLK